MIINKNNWENYSGWSEFEIENVLPEYLKVINMQSLEGRTIVSVGCGQGYPDCLLLNNNINLIGIDSNAELLIQAKEKGINTEQLDAYKIKDHYPKEIADIVIAPFLVHNTPNEQMEELYHNFNHLLKKDGKVVILDPNANYEHILADSNRTFRRPLSLSQKEYLNPDTLNPDIDKYMIEINLNKGLANETMIIHQHKSHGEYLRALEKNRFKDIEYKPVGYQNTKAGVLFPAYQLWTAKR